MNYYQWRDAVTGVVLFAALVIAGYLAFHQRLGAVLLALLSLVWLSVDRYFEGGVLISFSRRHGLVTADLVGVAGLVLAAWLFVRPRR